MRRVPVRLLAAGGVRPRDPRRHRGRPGRRSHDICPLGQYATRRRDGPARVRRQDAHAGPGHGALRNGPGHDRSTGDPRVGGRTTRRAARGKHRRRRSGVADTAERRPLRGGVDVPALDAPYRGRLGTSRLHAAVDRPVAATGDLRRTRREGCRVRARCLVRRPRGQLLAARRAAGADPRARRRPRHRTDALCASGDASCGASDAVRTGTRDADPVGDRSAPRTERGHHRRQQSLRRPERLRGERRCRVGEPRPLLRVAPRGRATASYDRLRGLARPHVGRRGHRGRQLLDRSAPRPLRTRRRRRDDGAPRRHGMDRNRRQLRRHRGERALRDLDHARADAAPRRAGSRAGGPPAPRPDEAADPDHARPAVPRVRHPARVRHRRSHLSPRRLGER
jgi:hypothetical protein